MAGPRGAPMRIQVSESPARRRGRKGQSARGAGARRGGGIAPGCCAKGESAAAWRAGGGWENEGRMRRDCPRWARRMDRGVAGMWRTGQAGRGHLARPGFSFRGGRKCAPEPARAAHGGDIPGTGRACGGGGAPAPALHLPSTRPRGCVQDARRSRRPSSLRPQPVCPAPPALFRRNSGLRAAAPRAANPATAPWSCSQAPRGCAAFRRGSHPRVARARRPAVLCARLCAACRPLPRRRPAAACRGRHSCESIQFCPAHQSTH